MATKKSTPKKTSVRRTTGESALDGAACSPSSGITKKLIRPKHHIVTKYWLTYYMDDRCTLCGNSGVIDTTQARTATGLRVGRKNYCICPNGQCMRVDGYPLENDQTNPTR